MNQASPKSQTRKKASYSLWDHLTGKAAIKAERARLEAFLNAFPGAYCGFGVNQETIAYHPACEDLLGISQIRTIHDVQNALRGSDSAALESYYDRLEEHGRGFTLKVTSHKDQKIIRINGRKGSDLEDRLHYYILWFEDISEQEADYAKLQEQSDDARQSLKRLTLGLESQPFPIWFHDIKGKIVWINAAYEQITGKTQADILINQIELPLKSRARPCAHCDVEKSLARRPNTREKTL